MKAEKAALTNSDTQITVNIRHGKNIKYWLIAMTYISFEARVRIDDVIDYLLQYGPEFPY